jgi:hypothetical protein
MSVLRYGSRERRFIALFARRNWAGVLIAFTREISDGQLPQSVSQFPPTPDVVIHADWRGGSAAMATSRSALKSIFLCVEGCLLRN